HSTKECSAHAPCICTFLANGSAFLTSQIHPNKEQLRILGSPAVSAGPNLRGLAAPEGQNLSAGSIVPMNKETLTVRKLARCAVVAALYVALCLGLAPFSYGAVQVRVAEALCLLPLFGPEYILGVTLGCALANLLGSTMIDVVFGTLATFLACLCTY